MTYAYVHPHIPPIHPSLSPFTLSSLLPRGIHFLLSIHTSVPPSTILPLQIYSGIQNEILSHFWLVLNAFIQNENRESDFQRGGVRARSLLTCRLYTRLSRCLTHVMWPDLSDRGVNKMKGLKEVKEATYNPQGLFTMTKKEAGSEAAPAPPRLTHSPFLGHIHTLHISVNFEQVWSLMRGETLKWNVCNIPPSWGDLHQAACPSEQSFSSGGAKS